MSLRMPCWCRHKWRLASFLQNSQVMEANRGQRGSACRRYERDGRGVPVAKLRASIERALSQSRGPNGPSIA
jgi:hypothetical protein